MLCRVCVAMDSTICPTNCGFLGLRPIRLLIGHYWDKQKGVESWDQQENRVYQSKTYWFIP